MNFTLSANKNQGKHVASELFDTLFVVYRGNLMSRDSLSFRRQIIEVFFYGDFENERNCKALKCSNEDLK